MVACLRRAVVSPTYYFVVVVVWMGLNRQRAVPCDLYPTRLVQLMVAARRGRVVVRRSTSGSSSNTNRSSCRRID